jgi:lysozyme family protein
VNSADFERAHRFTASWEGGYVNHPNDPGGETNLGVTRAVWEAWCKKRMQPAKPMRDLTTADVLPIYSEQYWLPLADALPWPLSAVAYDISVNSGVGRARELLGRVDDARDQPLLRALALCAEREHFYRSIVQARPSQAVFLNGWLRRGGALREWIRARTQPASARVFLKAGDGKTVQWDGRPATYGGQPIDAAWVAQMQTVYPPGTSTTLAGLNLTVADDGALLLSRATPTPT